MTDPSQITDSAAPNPQQIVVQKIRIQYAKRGRLRFVSHRDFARSFERAIRRARIPIGFSSGFSPHPKISFANAAPTGAGSEAEYLEIGLTRPLDVDEVRERLDAALPPGLDIVDAVAAEPGALADRLEASEWAIELPRSDEAALGAAVTSFLAADTLTVERMTKRGMRDIDVRGAVAGLCAEGTTVIAVVRATVPTVRPDDIVSGLREHGSGESGTPIAVRRKQGPLDGAVVRNPLRADDV